MLTPEQKEQIEIQDKNITENLDKIAHRIVVFSGKGGVGKTTVSVNLAYGLQITGYRTGLLDADITGPNIPKMIGLNGDLFVHDNRIIPLEKNHVKVISIASTISEDQPVILRGPMRSKLLNEFLGNVNWGQLDYLVADLPPGSGDEILTMTQKMSPDMAIIVTTPQEISLIDSARAINMAKKMEIPNIGLIENMSTSICPKCGARIDMFGNGGGKKQAVEMDVRFLGSLPLSVETRQLADEGKPIILEDGKANISVIILDIVKKIENVFLQ